MKILIAALSALFFAAFISSCGTASPSAAEKYHKINAQEAKARMEKNQSAVILDVRTKEEYNQKHIPRAVLLPLQQLSEKAPKAIPDKNAEILVYCRSGSRSRQAAEKLAQMGYTTVYDFGGIQSWPYETASDNFLEEEGSGQRS